ncbi:MAG: prepilin-type N-terminal cleavage/methylation domain-containing protein [Fimbriimonadaceae bacterium]|nr:prepilin-type N-terminal cleavage/methylation domain-containing protein [Fimbriimonadaceae bacterium]
MQNRRRAFTLIELLVVIAIIAILAAMLFPVYAQAKSAAKVSTSLSGLKQMALGLHIYSSDYDDMIAPEYGWAENPGVDPNQYHYNNTWVGKIFPYVKSKPIYFDKTIGEISNYDILYQDPYYPDPYYTYTWAWITTFSMNTDGYSRTTTATNACTGAGGGAGSSARSMTAFEDPTKRLAITPTRYGSISNWSWMRFLSVQAAWPTADRYANTFSWYQLVFDARKQYGTRFLGAYADGHAAKFGYDKFVKYYEDTPGQTEANTFAEFCAQMDARNLWTFWGKPWSGD